MKSIDRRSRMSRMRDGVRENLILVIIIGAITSGSVIGGFYMSQAIYPDPICPDLTVDCPEANITIVENVTCPDEPEYPPPPLEVDAKIILQLNDSFEICYNNISGYWYNGTLDNITRFDLYEISAGQFKGVGLVKRMYDIYVANKGWLTEFEELGNLLVSDEEFMSFPEEERVFHIYEYPNSAGAGGGVFPNLLTGELIWYSLLDPLTINITFELLLIDLFVIMNFSLRNETTGEYFNLTFNMGAIANLFIDMSGLVALPEYFGELFLVDDETVTITINKIIYDHISTNDADATVFINLNGYDLILEMDVPPS